MQVDRQLSHWAQHKGHRRWFFLGIHACKRLICGLVHSVVECSGELLPACEFSIRTVRYKLKYHLHYMDTSTNYDTVL